MENATPFRWMSVDDISSPGISLPVVDDDRQVHRVGHFYLPDEQLLLESLRTVAPIVVQADFSDAMHLMQPDALGKFPQLMVDRRLAFLHTPRADSRGKLQLRKTVEQRSPQRKIIGVHADIDSSGEAIFKKIAKQTFDVDSFPPHGLCMEMCIHQPFQRGRGFWLLFHGMDDDTENPLRMQSWRRFPSMPGFTASRCLW